QRDVQRFGLLGGTFDPIHYGHLVIAEEVRTALDLTKMVFVPAGYPPHKPEKTISETRHRLAMVELAIASNPHFSISTVDVERPGPSYTVETLRLLREKWGESQAMYLVMNRKSQEYVHT